MNVQKIIVPATVTALNLEAQLKLGEQMAAGDKEAREKLILLCVPLVKHFARSDFCLRYSTYDDAFQDGMLGVIKAVDLYDYQKRVKFTTFAYEFVHHYILRGVVKNSPVKISEKDFFNSILLNSTIETFKETHHFPPTNEQLSELTSIPLKTIVFLRNHNINTVVVSHSEDVVVYSDLTPPGDLSFLVDKVLRQSEQRDIINSALDTLSKEEREIIEKRYLYKDSKVSLKELAEELGFSSITSIARREKKALKKLLLYFTKNNLTFEDLI